MDTRKSADTSEFESFIPKSEANEKYENGVLPKKDSEAIQLDGLTKVYDPFRERNVPNPTTDAETLIHLLKASLGSGILSMPFAFSCVGLGSGLIITIITAFVCTYCSYILVKCAHVLYYRIKIHSMSYADIAEVSFANGPSFTRRFSRFARYSVMLALFITYFGAISCYTVIAGGSFQQVIEFYTEYHLDTRFYIVSVLPPLLLLSLIPNLKALAPFSMVANILIGSGLLITIYYLIFVPAATPMEIRHFPKSFEKIPPAISITVFAMEAIGLMMPLENNMKNPKHFLGFFGILNKGMSLVCIVYTVVGVIGYIRYGDKVADNITANLPIEEIAPQIAKISIAVSVLISYVLQFFVCLEIAWNAIKDKFVKSAKFYNKLLRMTLVILSVSLAVAIPKIGPFVNLVGALCFSTLGILFPVFIELVTYWEDSSMCKLWLRNILIIVFGIMALIFGTWTSLVEIGSMYLPAAYNGTALALSGNSTGVAQ